MNSNSNTTSFATLTATYPAIKIASATAINTDTLLVTGSANASIVLDVLFRTFETSAKNFDVIICATGANTTDYFNRVQVAVPANAGNNGSIALASLAGLAPSLFDLDLAGNRVLTLEPGISVYIRNKAATTADLYVTAKLRNF
ncbi:hypothetical protein A0256_22125 [Mucilaginibacter sp. PAMC 26640]|nr:hypothetical protein A0256_22125 [Mucilaginibacter sp. PAMC 26640]